MKAIILLVMILLFSPATHAQRQDPTPPSQESSRVTIRLKSGIGYTADSVTVKDKTLIIHRYNRPDVELKRDELVETDARKFFPLIYAEIDKQAKEQQRQAAEAEAKAERAKAKAKEEGKKKAEIESKMGVATVVGRVLQVVDGGFLFSSLTGSDVQPDLLLSALKPWKASALEESEEGYEDRPLTLEGIVMERGVIEECEYLFARDLQRRQQGLKPIVSDETLKKYAPRFLFISGNVPKIRYVTGYPNQLKLADDDFLLLRARREGNYRYANVQGAERTVEKWVYWDYDTAREKTLKRDGPGAVEIENAAKAGDVEKVKVLLKANPELVNAKADTGVPPLVWAAGKGHKDVADVLLAHGADVNAKDKLGITPLHVAAMNGYKDMAELLLAHGAEVNAKTNEGRTPLLWALTFGHEDIAELLRAHGAKE